MRTADTNQTILGRRRAGMLTLLALSLTGAAALAVAEVGTSVADDRTPSPAPDVTAPAMGGIDPAGLPPGHPPVATTAGATSGADRPTPSVEGKVREVVQVDRYTYLRLESQGVQIWAAVPRQEVPVGGHARVADVTEMTDFSSPSLGRTFDRVYFGVLDQGAMAGSSPQGGAVAPAPARGSVERAGGATGKTIGEIAAQAAKLGGTSVRVRGKVTKRTDGVLGKTWLHVADGGDRDLVVTTADAVELGAVVLLEGRLATDRDLGSGYRYDFLLEDARVLPAGQP